MILKSFLLGNLLSLCMKIINSVVVVGLYYGFLTTFSIGPSYLFLLRAQVMEEGEEGTQKKVSATTGFITGQLMMFISIYYAPLHLALGRPHTITVLALPYLLFHFFWNNHKHFLDYGSTTRNSMRNLSIQCVFLNNLIFQLFNYFILPSSMLARLVNIYMFRCNNKMLFVTSSFVGWLIGHILFMKWVGLVLVWIRQNHSIRSNVLIRSNKYLVSEVRNSMARIFSILLFITCVYYLGRIPSPSVTKKLKETSETEERGESEEETDVEIEPTSKTKGTKEEQEGSTEEDPSPSLFSEEKEDPDKIDETEEIRVNGTEKTKDEFHFHFKETFYKNSRVYETSDLDGNHENSKLEILKNKEDPFFWFEKLLVIGLFDYKRWTRPLPLRYIKNERFENAVRNEMSQYFFYTCRSDGKQKISFMYTPSLSTFLEMIQRKMALYTTENPSSYELDNQWVYTNEQNENKLSNEFISRIEAIDKGSLPLDVVLEKKTRLCNDETKKEYLPKKYDPFSNGPYRGIIHFVFSPSIINQIPIGNSIGTLWINKIHEILIATSYREFEKRIAAFDRKSISTKIHNGNLFNFISEFAVKSICSIKILKRLSLLSEQEKKNHYSQAKLLFNAVINDTNEHKIRNKDLEIEIKEISKKIPRWSYKLIDELEQQERQNEEDAEEDHQIRSRKAKRVVIFTDNQQNPDTYTTTLDTNNSDQTDEVALIDYSQQSDFRRDIIKGSMRAQRRKITILELFQANVHSPFFFDRIGNTPLFLFDISELIKFIFINKMGKNTEFKISDCVEEDTNEQEKKEADKRATDRLEDQARIEIAEAWDSIIFAQIIRGSILVTQSILRRYIILPSLIIAKNMGRMLLFQFPEWSEDLKGWKREMHVKCTYNGVQLSETEFPKNWLIDGIQIKILFPFRLKPWHRSKLASPYLINIKIKKKDKKNDDFCFLTIFGMETELPFGSPRKRSSFFDSIFKKLRKKMMKWKTNCFIVLIERANFVRIISKEIKTWIIKNIIFIQRIIKELLKINPTRFFGLKEVSGSNETKKDKDLRISNNMIYESSSQIKSFDWTNYSLTEKKIKDLTDRANRIRTQIGKILKDKKNKKGNDAERFESPKTFGPMFKRRNIRLIRKSIFFIKFFFKKIYIYIFLFIINILQINTPLFLESKKKYMGKYIFNIKANQEGIDKTNQNTINFRKSLSNLSKNSQNLSSLSQAYVFYKLSQIQVNNLDKLRFILQYNGTSLFLTNEIKDYFGAQGILHSEFQNKKIRNFGINQWKTRLRGHYQYNLSKIGWSKLVPGKWRNRINQGWMAQNKDLNKRDSYEKDQIIYYKKKNYYKLPNKKDYGYDLLSYQSISYEDTKNSFIYVSPLQVNNNQGISCNYNTRKYKLFDGIGDILSNNYLGKNGIVDMDKNPDRKYGDWKMIHFCLRNTVDIETWINTNSHKKTKTINGKKIEKKGLMIHQQIKPSNQTFFDWMGMNEQIRNRPISNFKLWFFPEFALLYNSYKMKPWFIPIQLLLLNFNGDVNISATKNINENPKKDLSSNKINYLELENRKKKEKESPTRGNPRSDAQNRRNRGSVQEKDLEESYGVGSDIKKRRKKKEYQSNTEAELHLFLKRYLLFQLRWDDSLNQRMLNNIKVYCFLLRLINPREIAISSIQRGEMSLDIMLIQKDLTLTELMKKSLFIIESVRLSVTRDRKFLMYQTISISFVHKSKDKANQGNQEKRYVDKPIARHQKITENQNKNHYVLPVPENILSLRRRREFRILICLDSQNGNGHTAFCDGKNVKNCDQFLDKSTNLEIEKNKLIKLFLWPTYQLEDLACMNRYWFDTTNSSHFNMVRINMYPQ
uniref:Protein TIC 214 n=1 Tax=Chrysosplenium aureobracteatum TaxID=2316892 RepID=A0A385I266_9MAGN|nr:hypothetical chloroplast RF1 [Chrysosplenium aureobracteatum]AXY64003.1 hypothetical chloroplast RF1 [Chrysosplenium aureobracteatum]